MPRESRLMSSATGVAVAVAFWLVISELGLPHIAGIGRLGPLPLAATVGALIGQTFLLRYLTLLVGGFTVFLLVVAFTGVVEGPARGMLRRDAMPAAADAIVVLSGGVSADGMLPQQGLDRVLKAVQLSRQRAAPVIVLTRERKRVNGKWVTAGSDQERIVSLAGSPTIATGLASSTRDEAVRVARLARERGWKRIIVVTSAFHARRACATFEKVGLLVSCVPADSRDVAVLSLTEPDDRLRAFAMWSYEVAGTLRYRAAGWI